MTNTEPVTLINVFEVPQDELDAFAADWHTRAEFMSRQPGFRSFRLHRALAPDSKFQLVNVAEWDSAEALQTALAQPEFQAGIHHVAETFSIIAHPGLYRVVEEFPA
ncbi:monooxygenase [Mycolicibacterium porcinum]|uniref:antibiotic biosynthesis monooxygenase family protein n=1 Tax=Mycolicibacterium porcinum TaxID=39693 RepID=UPI00080B0CDF|nr:antibiotic biosynthesis monooxygenase family protein [Mycolicibacterium porcinum]OCB15799.1 monooxygenase [Mycolicibacterium porcinum]